APHTVIPLEPLGTVAPRRLGAPARVGRRLRAARSDPNRRQVRIRDRSGYDRIQRRFRMTTNMELIGRDEINDLEAILSVCNTDANAIVHAVKANADAVFTWDYERSRTP